MFKRITVGLDETAASERAVSKAIQLAGEFRASLHIVIVTHHHVLIESLAQYNGPEISQLVEHDRQHSLDSKQQEVLETARRAGIAVTVEHVNEEITDSVLKILTEQKADLLVMKLQQGRPAVSRLWSNVSALADTAPCCILGVP